MGVKIKVGEIIKHEGEVEYTEPFGHGKYLLCQIDQLLDMTCSVYKMESIWYNKRQI